MAEILDGVTDSELAAALAGKSNTGHVHAQYQTQAAADARYYQQTELDVTFAGITTALAGKAATDHGHNLTGLDDTSDTAPTEGQSPVWNAAAGEFRYEVLAEGGVVEHGALLGLTDDDHPQYHTDGRGDARYYKKAEVDTAVAAKANAENPVFSGTIDFGDGTRTDGSLKQRRIGRFAANGADAQKQTVARLIQNLGWTSGGAIIFTVYQRRYIFGGVYLRYLLRGWHNGVPNLTLIEAHGFSNNAGLLSVKLELTAPTVIAGDWKYWDVELHLDDHVEADVYVEANHNTVEVLNAFTTTQAQRLELWDTEGNTNYAYTALPDFSASYEVWHSVPHNFSAGLKSAGETVWHAGNHGTGSGLDADKLQGKAPATGATANTLALRDANGDLAARELLCTTAKLSAEPSTRETDTIFYSSTDNGIRKNTKAGFLASLGLGNVNNTADADKPISTATQAALDAKAPLVSRVVVSDAHAAAPDQIIAVDTQIGAVTVTAPADPAEGAYFYVGDAGANAATNNITVDFGAETYAGAAQDFVIDVDEFGTGFLFTGTTWRAFR